MAGKKKKTGKKRGHATTRVKGRIKLKGHHTPKQNKAWKTKVRKAKAFVAKWGDTA
jgi:hypothetical protein